MTELLPSLQAERIRRGLVDYLTTTFALADAEPRRALGEFLEDPEDGIFKGPYVRLRLPFRPADEGWRAYLDWQPPFPPYRHQAQAYARLTSKDLGPEKPRPLPTIVTTGTGSGKTEAFLHPILDHCLRARARGERGVKALVLYPMNALADDQAGRLARLIAQDPALAGITAALYTGDAREGQPGEGRTKVGLDGLITNRRMIQQDPPDILLTNYKMLDQLLLRPLDRDIWRQSALSLTYLVLDEFHTYDGAQGTDVAMLLRRLGITLKGHVPADHPDRWLYDERPLGRLTPVATSATLGDGRDPARMLAFAEQVFGETFTPDAAVTESRQDVDELTATARQALAGTPTATLGQMLSTTVAELAEVGARHRDDADALLRAVVELLHPEGLPPGVDPGDALLAHPDVRSMVEAAGDAIRLDELVEQRLSPAVVRDGPLVARRAVATVLAALSHLRVGRRDAVSVEVTLWVREVTRIDRLVSSEPGFRWGDDGALGPAQAAAGLSALPAVYCRSCGRSGWGVSLAATGRQLADRDDQIRRDHLLQRGRFRALLHAPGEAAAAEEQPPGPNLLWLDLPHRTLLTRRPPEDDEDLLEGRILPVLGLDGDSEEIERAARRDRCPSCGKDDSIRFLGSAVATLLSVSLSSLFGDRHLDPREKRALVFTDSVQDAAHRAGFVDHRSHAMSLRAALRHALTRPTALDTWVEQVIQDAQGDPFARYRLVPTPLLDHEAFAPYWQAEPGQRGPARVGRAVARRLLFDAALEVGLQSTYGRTLEATGALAVHVDAGDDTDLVAAARVALDAGGLEALEPLALEDAQLTAWVRGTLEHLRRDGAIDHPWLDRYVKDDGARHWIWGGRPREEGAPAFPSGRSAPAYAVVGRSVDARSAFVRVPSGQSWYARWAQKCLGLNPGHGASAAARLLAELGRREILSETATSSGNKAYGISPSRVVVTPLDDDTLSHETTLLVCDTCRSPQPVAPAVREQLQDRPCPSVECSGRMVAGVRDPDSFYRRLYESADMRRVDAREHTSLLHPAERREIEAGFKRPDQEPGDPNVLVATPTLEMGIDIGDLTTVMLASLPDAVAKYLQRVGRAGRLTGSSLALAYVTGRGEQLPRLGDPTSMINGSVRPPATYLDAEEILRRQFIASVIDAMVRDDYDKIPRLAGEALASAEPGTFLGDVVAEVQERGERLLERFVGTFADPGTPGLDALRRWALPDDDTQTDTLAATVGRAVWEHTREVEEIRRRRREIEDALPDLREAAERQVATDDDRAALRSANGALILLRKVLKELTDEPWITGLEIRGLLPNYSLIDDSVELDAQVSWVNPDTQQYETDPRVVERGSARALTELAPGAYFYARGLEMRVDGVEIGRDDTEVQRLALCDTCGYAADLGLDGAHPAPAACPRCGSTGIADTGQRMEVARLKRVFSDVRRDDARIGDDADDRRRTRFEVVPAVDFDPERCVGRWSVDAAGLDVAHYRRLQIRWLNLGRLTGAPAVRQVAGHEAASPLFRICEACGKLDKDAGTSSRDEHRAWCRYRNDDHEHTRLLALGRELVTQGVAIGLPPVVTTGLYSLPGLAAALLLGLRETMGGSPDHLRVEIVPHPVGDGGQVVQSLLLHDTVPGGTGYLTDLASPERLWGILVRAAQLLEECPCQDEGRSACYRCLLPFVRHADQAHRVEALRALKYLLQVPQDEPVSGLDVDQPRWAVQDGGARVTSGESTLEQRLRVAIKERMSRVAAVRERPGARGTELVITAGDGRVWTLEPQVDVAGTRPDFVLAAPGARRVAVYADGRAFHATLAHNRLADDAEKRTRLRDNGYHVVAVTHADLESPEPLTWLEDNLVQVLVAQPAGALGAGISRAAAAEHRDGPLAHLEGLIVRPDDPARARLAEAAAFLLATRREEGPLVSVPEGQDLVDAALALLLGETPPPVGDKAFAHQVPGLALLCRLKHDRPHEIALVIDDTEAALADDGFEAAWREWLRLGNVLGGADIPVTITTRTLVEGRVDVLPRVEPDDRPAWEGVDLSDFDPEVVAVARALAADGAPTAAAGEELDGGVVAELAWPATRVALVYEGMPHDESRVLREAGWAVVELRDDVDSVVADLRPLVAGRAEE